MVSCYKAPDRTCEYGDKCNGKYCFMMAKKVQKAIDESLKEV